MWMDEEVISGWAYEKCLKDDRKNFWSLITESEYAYWYCLVVNDRPEVRKNITDSVWSYMYRRDIANRTEIRKNITESGWSLKIL